MIKLSSLLEHILDHPMKGEAIQEAKRLEALDVPRNEAERKPLVNDEGDGLYMVWSNGKCVNWASDRGTAKTFADVQAAKTGQPHTVCQVMAPESGECPTIPVVTFTQTPEREHEWVIYRDINGYPSHWFAINGGGDGYWGGVTNSCRVSTLLNQSPRPKFYQLQQNPGRLPLAHTKTK